MARNVGSLDRWIRIIVGAALIVLSLMGTIGWWDRIGIIPLVAGAIGTCPIYSPPGLRACPFDQR